MRLEAPYYILLMVYLNFFVLILSRDVVSVSTSRSRDVPTSRLGLVSTKVPNVSVSDLCVSDLVLVSIQSTKAAIYHKRAKTEENLLWTAYRKSRTLF